MREIDDRYPEYARPYEPLRGGRHHGRLTGNEGAAFQRRLKRRNMIRQYYIIILAHLRLSKNYASAPASGKIGVGVLSWTNGKRTRGEMWYS